MTVQLEAKGDDPPLVAIGQAIFAEVFSGYVDRTDLIHSRVVTAGLQQCLADYRNVKAALDIHIAQSRLKFIPRCQLFDRPSLVFAQ